MRHYRCYHPEVISPDQDLVLTPEASHHLAVVLRARVGSPIEVFDVNATAYQGELIGVAKRVTVRLLHTLALSVESPLYIHLVQAIGKNDKIDWVIQKAVELGVSEITLLLTERTEVRLSPDKLPKKMAHWSGIMINAVEQSGRVTVPLLNPPISLNDFLALDHLACLKLMLHVGGAKRLAEALPPIFSRVQTLIGPEGGFSAAEVLAATKAGYQVIAMGPRVMRTETAPLAIISALQLLQGDF